MKQNLLVIFTLLAIVLFAVPRAQMRAEVALRAAMEQETVKGDLKGAIEAYRKIVDGYPKERAVQAQALLRMAECYHKLGDAQAKAIYQQLVRDYKDQSDVVTVARSRLDIPARSARDLTIRRLGALAEWVDSISQDGTTVFFTDWNTGDIAMRDLTTGQTTVINRQQPDPNGGYSEFGETPVPSRDGRYVAYTWCTKQPDGASCMGYLRVTTVPSDRGATRVLYARDAWTRAYDWSPDGTLVAVAIARDRTNIYDLALISTRTGDVRVLMSLARGVRPHRMFFSPDGRYLAFDTGELTPVGGPIARTSDIVVIPVAGGRPITVAADRSYKLVAGWTAAGDRLLYTSDSGGSADLYSATVTAGQPQGSPEVVHSGLGAITPLKVSASGTFFYTVGTGRGRRVAHTAIEFSEGAESAAAISAPRRQVGDDTNPQWSPDGQWLAYIHRRSPSPQARSQVVIESIRGRGTRELRPDLTTIGPLHWASDGRAIFTLGVDGEGAGGLYKIDVSTGAAISVFRKDRLSHLRLDAARNLAYFFETVRSDGTPGDARHRYLQLDLGTATERELFRVGGAGPVPPVQLSPNGSKLYYRRPSNPKGTANSGAGVAVIERDLATGAERELLAGRVPFMLVSPDGRHLAFRRVASDNKWSAISIIRLDEGGPVRDLMRVDRPGGLNLSSWAPDSASVLVSKVFLDPRETWWVPIDGRAPRKLGQFMGNLHIHPDGRRIAFQFGGDEPRRLEVRALEQFLPSAVSK